MAKVVDFARDSADPETLDRLQGGYIKIGEASGRQKATLVFSKHHPDVRLLQAFKWQIIDISIHFIPIWLNLSIL